MRAQWLWFSSCFLVLISAHLFGGDELRSEGSAVEDLIQQEFEQQLVPFQDWTFEQLESHLNLDEPPESETLSFDPEQAAHYETIRDRLKLTEEEQEKYKRTGFVVVDPQQRHNFGSVYYQIYAMDLPVLVTTDSVLHAWHRSYENLMRDIEGRLLSRELAEILAACHEHLGKQTPTNKTSQVSFCDVDLYLAVARNLLAGACDEQWNGNLIVPAKFVDDETVLEILTHVQSLKLQMQLDPLNFTHIYGSKRYVDYSQFRPRGYYTHSSDLKKYFRCMTWLSRADCGFFVLPVDHIPGVEADWRRELRDATLLSQLVRDSGVLQRLDAFGSFIEVMVGESDNLTVSQMLSVLKSRQVAGLQDLASGKKRQLNQVARALEQSGLARQRIRSQSIVSNEFDTYKVPPPALFQMFGQSFAIDSFALSHVVFDSIIFEGRKQKRMMPSGLDVAAALGNDLAVELLEPELRDWNYSANLMAARAFVDQLKPGFWNGNIYHRWLNALRQLDDTPVGDHLPEVMQGEMWRTKQLQTQLSSWSQLRHANVLYTKQSYTGVPGCQYPDGFVEPYPELYRALGEMAMAMSDRLGLLKIRFGNPDAQEWNSRFHKQQIAFLVRFAEIMEQLESIARQKLAAEPLTAEQRLFLESTIDRRGTLPNGSGSRPRYDGWYCDLLYGVKEPSKWDPVVIDVHTNPKDREVLQAGVGDVNFAVLAVDNEDDVAAYVGPIYSYFEFTRSAESRMTDNEWQQEILEGKAPLRPDWAASFTGSPVPRDYGGLGVHTQSGGWVVTQSKEGQLKQLLKLRATDEGLQELLDFFAEQGFPERFGLSLGIVSSDGLKSLVDVEQLNWIDTSRSKIPSSELADFRRQRPDVEVLPRPLTIETLVVCQKIDGLGRFEVDTSGKLQPGQKLLLYLEPKGFQVSRQMFEIAAPMAATITIFNASDEVVAQKEFAPKSVFVRDPRERVYTELQLDIPGTLEPGEYRLRVDVTDSKSGDASRSAHAELMLER